MGQLRELSDKLWSGELTTEERHPFAPLLINEELGERACFVSSFANVCVIDTDAGLVLVDTGGPHTGAMVVGCVRNYSERPVHLAIFTHGHVDHVMGMERFDDEARDKGWPRPRVIAHQALPARFDRYKLTGGYNSCINSRQFSLPVKWPSEFRYPDETFERALSLDVGGTRIELRHARGETDDHTWVWVPSAKVLCTGDLFIWASPNAGNPQKVQRYPREWAAALRRMADLDAEVLSPGHGVPIFGAARVRQALEETAMLLESLHDQTLGLMNAGASLDEILHTVQAPAELLDRPYLRPVYDEPEFVVRNVWRLYGGWWDGDPSQLKPAPRSAVATELAHLAGGADKLIDRAEELADAGELRLACHLAELAGRAAPTDRSIWKGRAQIYAKRAKSERSLMAQGIYRAASEEEGA
jgi:alkyl sulfatase BDS1-like metallo-beta-lactamase superfamily hydrolase